jgi:hypothetical protein
MGWVHGRVGYIISQSEFDLHVPFVRVSCVEIVKNFVGDIAGD